MRPMATMWPPASTTANESFRSRERASSSPASISARAWSRVSTAAMLTTRRAARARRAKATELLGRPDRAGRAEAELLLRRGGQVVVTATHVGAAVDHLHLQGAALVVQGDPGSAGQRLVRHADGPLLQGAATREPVPVEPRAIPRGVARHVDSHAALELADRRSGT